MTDNERRLLWIEMSIREIWTQCHFAEISYANIDKKSANQTDTTFSSIHSFLSHCTMISKLLNGKEVRHPQKQKYFSFFGVPVSITYGKGLPFGENISQVLNINETSIIHKRKFRNHLEHYDERLKGWIGQHPKDIIIRTYNIGPKSMFDKQRAAFISHYDDQTKTFTFLNQDLGLKPLYQEVKKIKNKADSWVKELERPKLHDSKSCL